MAGHSGVLVYVETAENKATATGREMLGIGRLLADALGEPFYALLVGNDMEGAGGDVFQYRVDKVYFVSDPLLSGYHLDLYTVVIAEACKQTSPSLFLLPHDDMGRDVAPRVAARLASSLVTDCIELRIDPATKMLQQTRQVYGGKAMEVLVAKNLPLQIVTVKPKAMAQAVPATSKPGDIVAVPVTLEASMAKITLIETVKEDVKGIKLEDAKVVVTGGRGIGDAEGFKMIHELAEAMGGAVGASRAPCDEGWVPTSFKIGQTGKTVSPDLYIAVGLSGALQHIVGSLGSKCIVAINNDPEAKIFDVSDFKWVADYREALPALTKAYNTITKI